MMSISFGGLGLMSLRRPFAELFGTVLGKGDIQSMFCVVVFCIVFLVLAYLTNPSENSFRAYLTELSFRQHLSRLDENIDDDPDVHQNTISKHISFRHNASNPRHTLPFDNRSPFHFANRASVSLRTPKHVFHSFGIFTIAAIIPLAKADRALQDQRDSSMISDSWFIGAFGKWWRGGVLEAWYQDVIARSSEEETWNSGILGMKTLDRLNEFNALPGLPFSTRNLPPHGLARGSPPRLRNRDKSSQRSGLIHSRSSTPPPLPKCVTLPLHTPRNAHSATERNNTQSLPHSQSQSSLSGEQHGLTSPVPTSTTSFDQSPRVVELLQQIALSQSSVLDLRTQLAETQDSASHAHSLLQAELDSCRERKRQEDISRNELKSRTKTLDDAKRAAEGTKRDAEKRLRAAESARDDATQRMEFLDKEIALLQQRLSHDGSSLRQSKENMSEAEHDIRDELECKKREIQVAEDVVAALNLRARELEDKLSDRKETLRLMHERAEAQKQEQSLHSKPTASKSDVSDPWSSITPFNATVVPYPASDTTQRSDVLPGDSSSVVVGPDRRSDSRERQMSARPSKLVLAGLSNFNGPSIAANSRPAFQSQGYFDTAPFVTRPQPVPGKFSPFADLDVPQTPAVVLSPLTSSSLIPAALISSLDNADGISRSFQSESDVFLDRDWRDKSVHESSQRTQRSDDNGTLTFAPHSLSPTADDPEHDPFEVRILSPRERERYSLSSRNVNTHLQRNNSDPSSTGYGSEEVDPIFTEKSYPLRWFSLSSKDKAKKGLNPDAKVFDMYRKVQPANVVFNPKPLLGVGPVYDALNPNGLSSTLVSSSASDSSTLLRAFAPSPAEREALQRGLGSSTNASLERLPSLSDVGSIPPSPSHTHAHAVNRAPPRFEPQPELGKVIPSWLQSLPRIRKPNFSPWDDEEPVSNNNAAGKASHLRP